MTLEHLSPEELELAALATLLRPEDVRYARAAGVDEYSFQVAEHAAAWSYLVEKAGRSEVTTVADVATVAGVTLPEGLTDREALVEALVALSLRRRAREVVTRYVDDLTSDDVTRSPSAAISSLAAELSDVVVASNRGHTRYFDRDAAARLAEVEKRAEARREGGLSGWPTGLPLFDDAGEGWQPGELAVVMGALNAGKSWLLLRTAAYAYWHAGAKVLFLSPESTVFDVEARLDAVVARFMGRKGIRNREVRTGRVDLAAYHGYVEELAASGRAGWVTRDSGEAGSFTVADVIAHAREHRPDLLVVDGFHLIVGQGKTWETMKESAEAIKGLAQALGIAVLAGHQATRDAVLAPDDAPRLGDSAYGLALVQAANRVVSLANKKGNRAQKVFKLVKNRDGEVPAESYYLRWNPDEGEIEQTDPTVDDDSGFVDWGD